MYERDITTEFIKKYQKLECLWKTSHVDYKNKIKRRFATKELLKILKHIDKDANLDTVSRKINGIRCAYNKEYQKVKASMKTASDNSGVHVPKLWYYNMLSFLHERFEDETNEGFDVFVSTADSSEVNPRKRSISVEIEPDTESTVQSPKKLKMSETFHSFDHDSNGSDQFISEEKPIFFDITQPQPSLAVNTDRTFHNTSEFEAVGINVAKKLAKMTTNQALHAECIISNVLRYGLQNKLTDDTDLCNNKCGFD